MFCTSQVPIPNPIGHIGSSGLPIFWQKFEGMMDRIGQVLEMRPLPTGTSAVLAFQYFAKILKA